MRVVTTPARLNGVIMPLREKPKDQTRLVGPSAQPLTELALHDRERETELLREVARTLAREAAREAFDRALALIDSGDDKEAE
jgi:hypothetical protein